MRWGGGGGSGSDLRLARCQQLGKEGARLGGLVLPHNVLVMPDVAMHNRSILPGRVGHVDRNTLKLLSLRISFNRKGVRNVGTESGEEA